MINTEAIESRAHGQSAFNRIHYADDDHDPQGYTPDNEDTGLYNVTLGDQVLICDANGPNVHTVARPTFRAIKKVVRSTRSTLTLEGGSIYMRSNGRRRNAECVTGERIVAATPELLSKHEREVEYYHRMRSTKDYVDGLLMDIAESRLTHEQLSAVRDACEASLEPRDGFDGCYADCNSLTVWRDIRSGAESRLD
jgi:hypothetical protein